MRTKILTAAALTALSPGAALAQAAKPERYSGETAESTKISFVISHGWVHRINTSVPTSCVSTRGGTARVRIARWRPQRRFRLGAQKAKVTVEEPWPARHYTFSSRRSGKRIKGKLALSYSKMVPDAKGRLGLIECYGTASFSLRPR